MAASDARPVPRKNVAFRVYFTILDADGDLVTGAAGLDSEYSGDGGTFADCTNEATEIASSSGVYYLDLAQAEMNYDAVCIIVKTSTSGAKTTVLTLYPEEAGDYRADVVQISGDGTAADNLESYCDGTTPIPANATQIAGAAVNTANAQIGVNVVNWKGSAAPNNTGDAYARLGAPAGASIAADLVVIDNFVDDLEGRLTATRAGYLDNLASAPPTAAAIADAVWNEQILDHTSAGMAGLYLFNAPDMNDEIATLCTDWANGGRLDLLIDAIKAKTDNLPAAPAATGDCITAAGVRTALGLASANLDTQIATLATASALVTTDSAVDQTLAIAQKLDAMLELDGAVYRYTVNALENAPAGEGGVGDWTTEEKQQIRDALGVDGTKTTAVNGQLQALDTVADLINAKTTNLPSDPADESMLESSIGSVNTQCNTIIGYLDTEIAAIKAKTDNLPASPAAAGDCITAAGIRTAVGLAAANLDTQLSGISSKTTNIPASPAAVGSAMTLASSAVDAIWDEVVEGSYTARQGLKLALAVLAGEVSGAPDGPIVYTAADGSKTRVTAAIDANGNRTEMTLDAS